MTRLSIEESKVALRDVEISNVDYPKKLLVDFSKASVKYVYDRVNGENVATTDEVKQIILHGKNAVVASKLKEIGLDSTALQEIKIHLLEDFEETLDRIEKEVISEIELTKSKVKLLWVQRANGGSYSDIQIVCDSYKLL